jgi:hypothetical protein
MSLSRITRPGKCRLSANTVRIRRPSKLLEKNYCLHRRRLVRVPLSPRWICDAKFSQLHPHLEIWFPAHIPGDMRALGPGNSTCL